MRAVVTVVGKDKTGIIAKVSTFLAERDVNILDISQTIMQNYFAMIMMVDTSKSGLSFTEMAEEMEKLGKEIGMDIRMQSESIFNAMHKI